VQFLYLLYRIVTNVALDHLRRRTSRREDQAPVPEDAEGGTRISSIVSRNSGRARIRKGICWGRNWANRSPAR